MKTKYFFLSVLVLAFVACSDDDNDSGTANPENPTSDYFPLTIGNQWTYNNLREVQNQDPQESTETLSVSDSTMMNDAVNYQFSSDAPVMNQGIVTGVLVNGSLTKVEGKLIYNGSFEYNFPGLNIPISFPLENLVVFDQNKDSGQNLTTINNSITQDLSLGENAPTVPVTFDYTFKTNEGAVLESYSAGDQQFNDVISSNLTLNISANANLGPISIAVLVDQQVLTSTNHFAKDIGLIDSNNAMHVEFEDLSEYQFPQLDPIDVSSSQTITDYSVQ